MQQATATPRSYQMARKGRITADLTDPASIIYSHEIARVPGLAYHPAAFLIAKDSGRVLWHQTFRPHEVGRAVDAGKDVLVAPQQIPVLVSHQALHRHRWLRVATFKQGVVVPHGVLGPFRVERLGPVSGKEQRGPVCHYYAKCHHRRSEEKVHIG